MEQKIRIGAVSYLNTKPMITGLENWTAIEMILDYPANVAKMLLEDKIDIGLIPVAIIPQLKEHFIISNYGISCNGKVASVCLFSEVPLEEIETVYLDYQSRTSVQLLKILLKEYWKKEVTFVNGIKGYENNITGTTAALVIGDRAFALTKKYQYVYDLGEAWKQYTDLPFVFATWVSNKKLSEDFVNEFGTRVGASISNYIQYILSQNLQPNEVIYLQKNIKYNLTSEYHKGLELFLKHL